MAIVTHQSIHHFPGSQFREASCFYCHEPVSAPALYWMGSAPREEDHASLLVLHPACTVELAIRLFRDVHEIECRTYEYVTEMPGIERLRTRLLREEGVR